MLSDEIGAYLAGAGLNLVLGTNLFTVPFPMNAQDAAVCIVEGPSQRSAGTFGASLSAPAVERPTFKVIVRDGRDNAQTARTTVEAIYKKLRRLGPVTLSGVQYLNVDSNPPEWLGYDGSERPRYHFDSRVSKGES